MNISPRTKTLLDRIPKNHPLSASMRNAVIEASAAADQFAERKRELARDVGKTPLGRQEALQLSLTENFGKTWAKAKAPIARARNEITSRRAALVIKAVDPANIAAALERQEIRQWFRSLDIGVRQSIALATKDRRILEALVTAPPELSGIAGASAASAIENHYIEVVYPVELAAIEQMDTVVAEAETGLAVARNDMASVADHLRPNEFSEVMKAFESKAAAPTEAPKEDRTKPPSASGNGQHVSLFSPEEEKEFWRPFDELVASIVSGAA